MAENRRKTRPPLLRSQSDARDDSEKRLLVWALCVTSYAHRRSYVPWKNSVKLSNYKSWSKWIGKIICKIRHPVWWEAIERTILPNILDCNFFASGFGVVWLQRRRFEDMRTAHSSLANCLGFTRKAEEETHSLRHLLSNCNGGRHMVNIQGMFAVWV